MGTGHLDALHVVPGVYCTVNGGLIVSVMEGVDCLEAKVIFVFHRQIGGPDACVAVRGRLHSLHISWE